MFKIIYPYHFKKNPKGYYPIDADPTLNGEVYLFCTYEKMTFEEVISHLKKAVLKSTYIGLYSMIYNVFYKEFYTWIEANQSSKDRASQRVIKKFRRKALKRWLEFLKYSDDTKYPQNVYIKKVGVILISEVLNDK